MTRFFSSKFYTGWWTFLIVSLHETIQNIFDRIKIYAEWLLSSSYDFTEIIGYLI